MSHETTTSPNTTTTTTTPAADTQANDGNEANADTSIVDTFFDIATEWAAFGLDAGKKALEQSARTLEKAAQTLDRFARELHKKAA